MGYNHHYGSRYTHLVSKQLTDAGKKMIQSFNGGRSRTRYRTRNKKSRYNKYASVYKKQSYKFNRRKRQ